MRLTSCLLAALLSVPLACAAQYRCVQPDGRTSFQQLPCPEGSTSRTLRGAPAAAVPAAAASAPTRTAPAASAAAAPAPRQPNWSAIARGVPEIGMTAKELETAMGRPNSLNAGTGPSGADQWVYLRGSRNYLVTLRDGVVTSYQEEQFGDAVAVQPQREACPTPAQVRDLEFEASKIANRDNAGLQDALTKARSCR